MNAVDKQDTQPTFFDNSLTGFFHISSYHCISDCGGHSWSFHIRIKFGMRLVVVLLRGKPGLANIFSSFFDGIVLGCSLAAILVMRTCIFLSSSSGIPHPVQPVFSKFKLSKMWSQCIGRYSPKFQVPIFFSSYGANSAMKFFQNKF